jgi:hypothetical protein
MSNLEDRNESWFSVRHHCRHDVIWEMGYYSGIDSLPMSMARNLGGKAQSAWSLFEYSSDSALVVSIGSKDAKAEKVVLAVSLEDN